MTTGQRIALKRKEAGLSQETLGAELGVSRQSIYKWESDTALPEIDKLVALSRRFGVTVGWLLGVEEAPETASAPDSGELTDAQLKMVEEITERYLAAQTAPKPRKKWPYVLAALAVLCAAYNIYDSIRTIGRQFDGVYNRINQMEQYVQSGIQHLRSGGGDSQTAERFDSRLWNGAGIRRSVQKHRHLLRLCRSQNIRGGYAR